VVTGRVGTSGIVFGKCGRRLFIDWNDIRFRATYEYLMLSFSQSYCCHYAVGFVWLSKLLLLATQLHVHAYPVPWLQAIITRA